MFNRWNSVYGNDPVKGFSIAASGNNDDSYLDFYNSRNIKLGIYANWGPTPGSPTGGTVTLIPGMGPADADPTDFTDSRIRYATNDPAAGVVTQALAAPVLNTSTGDYESFTVVTLVSSEFSRFVNLLFTNSDASAAMQVILGQETSQ